ncbi:hypothetical protein HDV03_003716 [Kappamyces sp. JEL0829]|nr:hypothetical protein HDV03_003716 [Kappamyces sp. JEL0829]
MGSSKAQLSRAVQDEHGTVLNISGVGIAAAQLKALLSSVASTSISTLNLSNNELLTDKEMDLVLSWLQSQKQVLSIDVANTQIGDNGVSALLASPATRHLRHLSLAHANFGSRGARELAKFLKGNTTLVSLDVSSNSIRSTAICMILDALVGHESLKVLKCGKLDINDEQDFLEKLRDVIPTLPRLEKLCISEAFVRRGFEELGKAFWDRRCSVQCLQVTVASLSLENAMGLAEIIRRNTSLSTLDVRITDFPPTALETVIRSLDDNTTLEHFLLSIKSSSVKEMFCKSVLANRNLLKPANTDERLYYYNGTVPIKELEKAFHTNRKHAGRMNHLAKEALALARRLILLSLPLEVLELIWATIWGALITDFDLKAMTKVCLNRESIGELVQAKTPFSAKRLIRTCHFLHSCTIK